eukprot:gene41718-9643_t
MLEGLALVNTYAVTSLRLNAEAADSHSAARHDERRRHDRAAAAAARRAQAAEGRCCSGTTSAGGRGPLLQRHDERRRHDRAAAAAARRAQAAEGGAARRRRWEMCLSLPWGPPTDPIDPKPVCGTPPYCGGRSSLPPPPPDAWVDLQGLDEGELEQVGALLQLHELTIEDVQQEDCPEKLEAFDERPRPYQYGLL